MTFLYHGPLPDPALELSRSIHALKPRRRRTHGSCPGASQPSSTLASQSGVGRARPGRPLLMRLGSFLDLDLQLGRALHRARRCESHPQSFLIADHLGNLSIQPTGGDFLPGYQRTATYSRCPAPFSLSAASHACAQFLVELTRSYRSVQKGRLARGGTVSTVCVDRRRRHRRALPHRRTAGRKTHRPRRSSRTRSRWTPWTSAGIRLGRAPDGAAHSTFSFDLGLGSWARSRPPSCALHGWPSSAHRRRPAPPAGIPGRPFQASPHSARLDLSATRPLGEDRLGQAARHRAAHRRHRRFRTAPRLFPDDEVGDEVDASVGLTHPESNSLSATTSAAARWRHKRRCSSYAGIQTAYRHARLNGMQSLRHRQRSS